MDYGKFKNEVNEHLIYYKENELKVSRSGEWRGKPCKHILHKEDGEKNFLFKAKLSKNKKAIIIDEDIINLHQYWYHLNSSQVMCINFFYKLIKSEEGKEILIKIIGQVIKDININKDVKIIEATFEHDMNEIKGENTNFDFYIRLSNGVKIFWEIKYTENGFGKAKPDQKTREGITHKKKFEEIYEPNLDKAINFKNLNIDYKKFLDNYQINRNVFYVRDKNEYSIFLIPKDNEKACTELEIIKEYKNVYKLTWEEIYEMLEKEIKDNKEYKKYYDKFYNKYLEYNNNK